MYPLSRILPVLATSMLLSTPAFSADARSIALGGSAIANAQGVAGAVENPASMMQMKRNGDRFHFRFGISSEVRDTGSVIETLTDSANDNLVSDIETQIDELSNRQIQCDPVFGNADDICLSDTQSLSDLANQFLNAMNNIDGQSVEAQASGDIGMAFTKVRYPIAVNFKVMGSGAGTPDIAESDKDYIREFANLLDNNSLTLDEIANSTYLEADALGIPLGVQQPEDVLLSSGTTSSLLRSQLSISIASTINVGGYEVDTGITPKFSSLAAYHLDANIQEELDDDTDGLADRFEDSEATDGSFTFDIGAAFDLKDYAFRVAAVVRNLIPESITTESGFEFETTPQLIVGGLYKTNKFSFTGDMALNKAKVDNFETQKIAFGAEYGSRKFALRAGLSYEGARSSDQTALSVGFGLGPLQFGIRGSDVYTMESSLQLAYSF